MSPVYLKMTILKAPKFPNGVSKFGKNKDNLRLLIRVYRLVCNLIFKIETIFNIYVQFPSQ